MPILGMASETTADHKSVMERTMSDRSTKPKPRVVIVGGGFGGLSTAKGLADAPFDITLIDRNNHHLFQPLLYQVATAALFARRHRFSNSRHSSWPTQHQDHARRSVRGRCGPQRSDRGWQAP